MPKATGFQLVNQLKSRKKVIYNFSNAELRKMARFLDLPVSDGKVFFTKDELAKAIMNKVSL